MKLLVTGFDPFGGEALNPSIEAVKKIKKEIAGVCIETLELPTVFGKSASVLVDAIETIKPDWVICVGQAGGRSQITFERVAINVADASIADNEGNAPIDQAIESDGPAAYFTTLPIKAMTSALKARGIPASVSNTAGTYVCNHIMYTALHYASAKMPHVKAGFIHIPYLLDQVVSKPGVAGMPLDTIVLALEIAIEAAILHTRDLGVAEGAIC